MVIDPLISICYNNTAQKSQEKIMKHYEAPVLEVVLFEDRDLLGLSNETGDDITLPEDDLRN